jgi:hypothetical protein
MPGYTMPGAGWTITGAGRTIIGGGATYTGAGMPIPIDKRTPLASAGAGMTHVTRLIPRPTNIPTVHARALLRFIRLSSLTCQVLLTDTLCR